MPAVVENLAIEQGATFTMGFTWHEDALDEDGNVVPGEPRDLDGCTARMQIRKKQGLPSLLTATSKTDDGPGAGRIILESPEIDEEGVAGPPRKGHVYVELTDEDTDLLTSATALYDLEIEWPIQPGQIRPRVDRLLQGSVAVSPNITQETEDPVVK